MTKLGESLRGTLIGRDHPDYEDARKLYNGMIDKSMTSPSSQLPSPGPLWPPPRMAMSSSFSRPKFTAAMTSATSAHRAIMSGRLSIIPL